MKPRLRVPTILLLAGLTALAPDAVRARERSLARVNGESIGADELRRALAVVHAGTGEDRTPRGRQDPAALLERLITARLIVQEARNIGLDAEPEVRRAMDQHRLETLRDLLLRRRIEELPAPSRAEVERRYVRAVAEVALTSAIFENEAAARRFRGTLDAGVDFDLALADAVETGQARREGPGPPVALAQLVPALVGALEPLEPGAVTEVLAIEAGWGVVRLLERRVPEDPQARATAEREALEAERLLALASYNEALIRRHAKVDQQRVDALSYDAAPANLGELAEDSRVVASIAGAAPITVGDLTRALQRRFFHGAERAGERGRLDRAKPAVLHDLLVQRVTIREAERLRLDRTQPFRTAMREFEDGLLFGTFVARVVNPAIAVDEAAAEAHYEAHREEFAAPEELRLEALVFEDVTAARDALAKLRAGADYEWLRENAPRRIAPGSASDHLQLGGSTYKLTDLVDDLQPVLAEARAGDARLYEDAYGVAYVVRVRERTTPTATPYDAVRGQIVRQLFDERRNAAIEDWAAKLRAASSVELLVTPQELESLARSMAGGGG